MDLLRKISVGLFVVAVVLLAIIMGGIRLAITNIDYLKSEIEFLLTRDISGDIVFTGLSGDMNRFNPVILIENVSIDPPDQSQPLIIDRLEVEFDFWASLREQAPIVLEVSGQLDKLELVKDQSGRWWSHQYQIGAGADPANTPEFARALILAPRYLKLDLRRLILRDEKFGRSLQLDNISAHVNHQSDQFFIQLSAALPEELGQRLLLKSVIDPDRSLVYANSSNLKLPAIADLFDIDTYGLIDGALDGEVWIDMSGYRVIAVSGDMVLKQGLLQSAADRKPLPVEYHARFNAIKRKSSWSIANDVERLRIDGENVLGFSSQIEIAPESESTRISAWLERLQVSSLPVLAGQWLPAGVSRQIEAGKFTGLLQDVMLSIDLDSPEQLSMRASAIGISSMAAGNFPGATNLNADLLLGKSRLAATLQGEDTELDFGEHFKAPLQVDKLELHAVATREESGELVLAVDNIQLANQDVSAVGRMWMEIDPVQSPFMFLRVNFVDARGSSTRKYLPLKFMPKKTQDWLDRGILGGHVPSGDLQYHGRLRDVREFVKHRSGEFFVDFKVEQGDVFFAPEWLRAKDGNGRVLFHNAGVEFNLDQVSYGQIDQATAHGSIANFDKPELELEIKTRSPTVDAVDLWINSPVGEPFRRAISNLDSIEGNVDTRINLKLPLSGDDVETEVHVDVNFDNTRLVSDNWGLELAQINGSLQVAPDRISSSKLIARFFDDPIRIKVASTTPGGATIVKTQGLVASRNLLKKLPESMGKFISGKSDWKVQLDIARQPVAEGQPYVHINAISDLKGSEIALPAPFSSAVENEKPIVIDLDILTGEIRLNLKLDSAILGKAQLVSNNDRDFKLTSLELAFAEDLKPSIKPGLHLHGNITDTSIDHWFGAIRKSKGVDLELPIFAELYVDRLGAFNRVLERASLEIEPTDERAYGSIESSLLRGKFEIPLLSASPTQSEQGNPQNPLQSRSLDPILINLEYLRLDKLEQESSYGELLPGEFRHFQLKSEALVYHDMLFNDLVLEARPDLNSLFIENFSMRRDEVIISSTGQWHYDSSSGVHRSTVNTSVQGPNFGEAIAGIGFGDTMGGGQISLTGEFSWQAPMLAFELDKFFGNAKLKIEEGVLNNVEPGSGRFVGLLSLSALPRRLSLDFSDVLVKGMPFDEISGNYQVDKGVLTTTNTRLDGPAAKIKITGSTGILTRDYDQIIKVTPKLRQTLPIIGAVSAGSTIGWGLLLLQNLFKKQIDDAVEVEYRITGNWDDPKIDLLKAVDENEQELPRINTDK